MGPRSVIVWFDIQAWRFLHLLVTGSQKIGYRMKSGGPKRRMHLILLFDLVDITARAPQSTTKIGGFLMVPLAALALPIVVLLFGGWLMLEVSGRNRIAIQASLAADPLPKSLASRIGGYNAEDALTYWNKLDDDGRRAELTFLQIDLLFAVFYSAALAFSIITVWTAGDFRFNPTLLMIPVVVALVADWTETAIHMKHLQGSGIKALLAKDIDPTAIKVASIATVTKWISVGVACLTPVALLIITFATREKHD
ncbi:MAG TPA: hypothetical protein VNA22_08970 [Pyrinomonadaceae bacterium]|nr:hypothetical protein [Pyrinomonadaceae bacterium]